MILLDELISSVKNTARSKLNKFSQNLVSTGFWLFAVCTLLYTPFALSEDCLSNRIDQYSTVKQVYDGDTVKLTNGKKIRLIGINTPEMNYKTGEPEPFAKAAKTFLTRKVLKKKIGIRYGADKKDRHGRYLAHIFLNDELNLQQALLEKGLAVNISFPPNLWQQGCYMDAEKEARKNKIGVWKNHHKNIILASNIKPTQTGFQFIKGRISNIKQDKKIIWLNLSTNSNANKQTKTPISLKIYKKNLSYFKNMNIEQLKGKKIIVKGWISRYKKHYYMTVRHPNALQIL